MAKFIQSQRNGKLLIFEGYLYRKKKNRGEKTDWQCYDACGASMILQNDQPYKTSLAVHNHPPQDLKINEKRFKEKIYSKIKAQPLKSVVKVYEETRAEFLHKDDDMDQSMVEERIAAVPRFEDMKSSAQRRKRKIIPQQPAHRFDVELTGIWQCTEDGRSFVLHDDGKTEDRIIIFGTPQFVDRLCKARVVFMDGTFKSVPNIYAQLYTLHCQESTTSQQIIPMLYVLLPDKRMESYTRMLAIMKTVSSGLGFKFEPEIFHIDYEMAVISAINNVFPNVTVRGCLFHYTQSIWRHVQEFGLATLYKSDMEVRKSIRRMMGLAMVNPDKVDDVFLDHVMAEKPTAQNLDKLFDYFVNTWFHETQATFKRNLWNHWHNYSHRTTNHLEGWHNRLNRQFARHHPNVYEVISVLKLEQQKVEDDVRLLECGNMRKAGRKKYCTINKRIDSLKEKVKAEEISLIQYLDDVSVLIQAK